jgi:predicted GH43/DUF377 family glycosyl hydrolase
VEFFDQMAQFRGPEDKTRIEVALLVPLKKNLIKNVRASSKDTLNLEFSGMLRDVNLEPAVRNQSLSSLAVNLAAREKLPNAVGKFSLLARPQNADLALQVEEKQREKTGYNRRPFQIRDFSSKTELMLSDIQLNYRVENELQKKILPISQHEDFLVCPYPCKEISKHKPPLVYFEIYNIQSAGVGERMQISYTITSKENKVSVNVSFSRCSAKIWMSLSKSISKRGDGLEFTNVLCPPMQTRQSRLSRTVIRERIIFITLMQKLSTAICTSTLVIVCAVNLQAQTDWRHVTNHPVVNYGAAGRWDNGAVLWPAVIKDGDTLRMWYAGSDEILGLGTTQIGYAWSLNGISWQRYARNPVLSAELFLERGIVVCPAVIKDGTTFKMWYGAAGVPPRLIGYAISNDGIHWNRHADPVLQLGPSRDWDGSIMGPGTIQKENGVYKMWYWGGQESWPISVIQIGLAISHDGIHWVKYNDISTTEALFSSSDPVLKIGDPGEWDQLRVWSPAVLATDAGYEMWYAGRAGYTTPPQLVGYATSTDGITWKKSEDNPVIGDRPAWGFSYITSSVLEFNGYYHLCSSFCL